MQGNWRDIDYAVPAGTAFVKAIRNNVMTCHQNKFQVQNVHPGFKANYAGYGRVSIDAVVEGGGIVIWREGFAVVWPNEFWDDRELPIKKIPVWKLDAEQRAMYDRKIAEFQRYIIHPDHWDKGVN